jgi:hypothetical protein
MDRLRSSRRSRGSVPLALEGDLRAIWRPGWLTIERRVVGEVRLSAAVRVHHVDLEVAVPGGREGELVVLAREQALRLRRARRQIGALLRARHRAYAAIREEEYVSVA